MIVPVGIALGSNLGDSAAELDAGVAFLRSLSAYGRYRESHRMTTVPVDCPHGSPHFLNMVVEIELNPEDMHPRELLKRLQAFEISRGRPQVHDINAPRPLDLDIIYYGDLELRELDLIIPHPRAHLRHFVLEPIMHLRPDLILPGQSKTVRQLVEEEQ